MATVKAKLNVCRASKSGKYPVVLQIIHRRKRRVIGTGIKLMPEDFDMRRERVIRRVDSPYRQSEIAAMNRRIGELRSMLIERLARLEGRDYTVDDITVWIHHQSDRKYLFPYFEQLIDEKMKARKWGIAYAYRATIRSLKGFCGSDSLQLADVDARFVRNYELYLQCQGISLNTIAYYLRNLRTVYNRAEADGLLRLPGGCSPFQKVKSQIDSTFVACAALEEVTFAGTIGVDIALNGCPKLTVGSLLSLLNALKDGGTGLTCNIGTKNRAKLSAAQQAIATDKGWVLT